MKDFKETIETLAVALAVMAITPFFDIVDIPAILFLSKLLNLTYAQFAGIYYLSAIILLVILAPKKLKVIYEKVKRWF